MGQGVPKILIVDESQDLLENLTQLIEDAGYSVSTARTYDQALLVWRDSYIPPDLIITGIDNGNQTGGRSLADLLQEKQVPVIIMSDYGDISASPIARMVNQHGLVGAFEKNGYDPEELLGRLNSILCGDYRGIRWLHLSDLHFRDSDQLNQRVVIGAFWQDLEYCCARGLRPDFIIVTGDIAYSGSPEEYELAGEFFDHLLDRIKVPKRRLFLVPGNHDVDVDKISPLTRGVLEDKKMVREVIENQKDRWSFMDRFHGYKAFLQSYFKSTLVFNRNRYFYSKSFKVDDTKIAILGLNSAWTSGNALARGEKSDNDEGNLVVGEKQVVGALEAAKDADVRIAIMHHPLSYLRPFDKKDLDTTLRKKNCHFLLHGHLHQSNVERRISPKGELIIIPAGAMYQGREWVNAYNYAALDIDRDSKSGRVCIVFRRYSDAQREWIKDLDLTGDREDGECRLDLRL